MQLIPLLPKPAQGLTVSLASQSCDIVLRQRRTGLYLDLTVDGVAVTTGALCIDRAVIVRRPYRTFVGDLAFIDRGGMDDPVWTGLGTRWVLGYFSAAELTAS